MNQREQALVESFRQIAKQSFLPLDIRIRVMDWQRTTARPFGVEISILPRQEDGTLTTKEKEVLLAVAANWREVNFPGKTVEQVDKLGIFVTVHQANPIVAK